MYKKTPSPRKELTMEIQFRDAVGKSMGEVIRDISEFLSAPCIIHAKKQVDLCTLLPDLNMREQFLYALLCEAKLQGWENTPTERFCRLACSEAMGSKVFDRILQAFVASSQEWQTYTQKYGNCFSLFDGSYWATALALGIDSNQVEAVMHYFRLFTVTLTEFAYMEKANPESTYAWGYYESFRRMLDDLIAPPALPLQAPKIRAIGGSAGKRQGDSYILSLGVDLENPNAEHLAKEIDLNITLKDQNGEIITEIKDRIAAIPPKSIYHYGVTRRICGAPTSSLSAKATAKDYQKTQVSFPQFTPSAARLRKEENQTQLSCILRSDQPIKEPPLAVHYQFLSADHKILGGGSEWKLAEPIEQNALPLSSTLPLSIKGACKILCSVSFEAKE
jgi:hypothetical protein